ncbi:unnamed protein product [Brassicogethes aeneus]|uniref:CUB domain-containing protein n=1 Tax=Brassicogethes aeneus TaxID=1431903 RepID=A0A9P0FHW8_BRAAE|nr:unnamed protein product [Brassicogethes aeneus]
MLKYSCLCMLLTCVNCVVFENGTEANVTASDRNFISACGDVFTKKQFVLESANYPLAYPENADCSYLIKGPYCPTYFQFQFLDFNVEQSPGCVKDRLEVDNLDALCGTKNGIKNYYSKTGALQVHFKSDATMSGRGYKILISRLPCNMNTNTTKITPEKPIVTNYIPATNSHQCCLNTYNSKIMLITSPNFPYTVNSPIECVYKIQKHNNMVCRLRMEFIFFNLGQQKYNDCQEGHIEIDGKLICGCKANLKLISQFNEGEHDKVIRFKSSGLKRPFQTGFVIKVIQDECPKRYIPAKLLNNLNGTTGFHFYNDQKNKVAWPGHTQVTLKNRLHDINERTEILDDNVNTIESDNAVTHIYYFSYPEEDEVIPQKSYKDVEETSYVYTVNINYILPDSNDFNYCYNWHTYQFNNLYSTYNKNSLQCQNTNQGTNNYHPTEKNCVDLNYVKGYFKSPGYPLNYPSNVNICYRFRKQTGYCAIKVYVNDFQLEPSQDCNNAYLLWANGHKFCGDSLHNSIGTFDFTTSNHLEASFVSNRRSFYCQRGFYGTYEQVPCQDNNNYYPGITPYMHTTPKPYVYPTPAPTVKPTLPCDKIYQELNFDVEVYGNSYDRCVIMIKKANPKVCKVNLYLEVFNLQCSTESITINEMVYCGKLSGKLFTLDLEEGPQELIYRRLLNPGNSNLIFRIKGNQIRNSCPEVEPARITLQNLMILNTTNISKEPLINQSKIAFSMKNQHLNDICGIISNSTDSNISSSVCEELKFKNNVTYCSQINDNISYVPFSKVKTLDLNIRNNKTEKLEYQEIDCDNLVKYRR